MKYQKNKSNGKNTGSKLSKSKTKSKAKDKTKSKTKVDNVAKVSRRRSSMSNKVNKIIQGGGGNNGSYYSPNTFNNKPIEESMVYEQKGSGVTLFNTSNLLLLVIVLLLLTICYLIYINYNAKINDNNLQLELDINETLINETKKNNINNKKHKKKYGNDKFTNIIGNGYRLVGEDANNPHTVSLFQPVLHHNMERVINPLLPPERSYVNTYGIPTNIPTRGFSGGFQQVGSLHKYEIADENTQSGNNTKSIILPLYGRPLYPGANLWNYYTTTDKHNSVKITFKIGNKHSDDRHGVNELMSDDNVEIPEYNGTFKVKIYQFDQPRYIPYVY
jgi:hypothetical protein